MFPVSLPFDWSRQRRHSGRNCLCQRRDLGSPPAPPDPSRLRFWDSFHRSLHCGLHGTPERDQPKSWSFMARNRPDGSRGPQRPMALSLRCVHLLHRPYRPSRQKESAEALVSLKFRRIRCDVMSEPQTPLVRGVFTYKIMSFPLNLFLYLWYNMFIFYE